MFRGRFVHRIARNGNSLTVALPQAIVAALDLHRGESVVVTVVGEGILLSPVERKVERQVREDATAIANALQAGRV